MKSRTRTAIHATRFAPLSVASSVALLGAAAAVAACGDAVEGESAGTPAPSESTAVAGNGFGETFTDRGGVPGRGILRTEFGDEEIEWVTINGERVWQGDIVLPDTPEYRSTGVTSFGSRWPNGVVPYEDNLASRHPTMVAAMKYWHDRTRIAFIKSSTQGARIKFVNPTDRVCQTDGVGAGFPREVRVNTASCGVPEAVHELGHALGFFHEHQRTDRDSFVKVNTGCIQSGKASDFSKFGSSGFNNGPYDITSIMQYGSTAFLDASVPGCTATITDIAGNTIPRRTELSLGDLAGMQMMYAPWHIFRRPVDYDNDGKQDPSYWRPSDGRWRVVKNGTIVTTDPWGVANDIPVPADYDNDGKIDIATYRPTEGKWYTWRSSDGVKKTYTLGSRDELPFPGNFVGDSKTDLAVWNPASGNWRIWNSQTLTVTTSQWGAPNDVPVPMDYDLDGKLDLAVWRPSDGFWHILKSTTGGVVSTQWGQAGDIPVPGNYDTVLGIDLAVWRPSTGTWWVHQNPARQWGQLGDAPVPADMDGDGRLDFVVFRPTDGKWYFIPTTTGATLVTGPFGAMGDVPVP
jgi:hypothetical protein